MDQSKVVFFFKKKKTLNFYFLLFLGGFKKKKQYFLCNINLNLSILCFRLLMLCEKNNRTFD
jgi:hypothetical protein